MRRLLTIASLFVAGNLWGQVGSPLLGYLPDGARFRPVNGIPAAAAIAPALDLKQDFSQIAASPAHDYVLVASAKQGALSIFTPARGLSPLIGAGLAPHLIAMSPRGSAAVLWFSPINTAQLVTGLPAAPVIRQISASYLRGTPTSLAISDDGKWLAGVWPSGLYVWGPFGQVNRLPVEESVDALAFFPGRTTLAIAAAHHVLTINAVDNFSPPSLLYDADDWVPDVAALAVSPNNARVILADRSGSIVSIETSTGKAVKVDCSCQPEGLFGMGQSAFRLTGMANNAFQLFDSVNNEVLSAPLALREGDKQ
jgi:hypothetical protein